MTIIQEAPVRKGYFGDFGGQFIPVTLMSVVDELEAAYQAAQADPAFQRELDHLLKFYAGRPTPLYHAERMSVALGGAKIYLKREDLLHTGAHKLNNTLGQILLARHMGKKRIIAETGAGQHGVATATVSAKFGLPCVVYMGEEDVRRQALNVYRMQLLGAEVVPVTSGSRTLKDAINEALRDWVANCADTFYLLGSCMGPHPYPTLVRDFQSVIGRETRIQVQELEGRLPDICMACVGGGSNAIGMFHPFIGDTTVRLIGVEAGGCGVETGKHAATLTAGAVGVLHGSMSYLLQDAHGQVLEAHSISAGLDYPGVGPEHSFLKDSGRAEYYNVTDTEALAAFHRLSREEGIIPALESSHALAQAIKMAPTLSSETILVVNLSGRGDKDLDIVRGAASGNEQHHGTA